MHGAPVKIIIDTREQAPFEVTRFPNVETERGTLATGDYSLPGFEDCVAIERKSLDDLIACLQGSNRERFERELQRARHYNLFAVVVEASLDDVRSGPLPVTNAPTGGATVDAGVLCALPGAVHLGGQSPGRGVRHPWPAAKVPGRDREALSAGD
jgi:hypothetical protein